MRRWLEQYALDPAADDAGVWRPRPLREQLDLEMTPLIDVTFLLLVFFLVATVPEVQAALELPPARHGIGVSRQAAVSVTLAWRQGQPAAVYLADGKQGDPLDGDPAVERQAVRAAMQQALSQGKRDVLIKAERGVLYRDVARVAAAATSIAGMRLNLAVLERED